MHFQFSQLYSLFQITTQDWFGFVQYHVLL